MSGKTDRRITFLSLTTAALPPDGSGVACRSLVQRHERAQYKAETFAFFRLYRHIRKPLMPIRHPIAFRGTARPSVCSAWRLKVPKIERLTHPKPYIVSKLGAFPKPRLTFVISETCKPFSTLSAFSLLGATKAVLRVRETKY